MMMVITMMTVMTLMTLMSFPMLLSQRDALALKEQMYIKYRSRSWYAKTWPRDNRSMTSEILLSFCVINVITRHHCHHRNQFRSRQQQ